MYASGAIASFVLSFIIMIIQGIKRRGESGETFSFMIFGALFGALFFALLSWLGVAIFIFFLLTGMVWGVSERNL